MADRRRQIANEVYTLKTLDPNQKARILSKLESLPDNSLQLDLPLQSLSNPNDLSNWALGFIGKGMDIFCSILLYSIRLLFYSPSILRMITDIPLLCITRCFASACTIVFLPPIATTGNYLLHRSYNYRFSIIV